MMGQSVPSASLQVIQNWGGCLIHPRTAIQNELNRLEKDTNRNFMKCNKWKYKVLNIERHYSMYQHRLGANQQYAFAAKAANTLLGYNGWCIASRWREVILHLCSALVTHLERWVQSPAKGHKDDEGTEATVVWG